MTPASVEQWTARRFDNMLKGGGKKPPVTVVKKHGTLLFGKPVLAPERLMDSALAFVEHGILIGFGHYKGASDLQIAAVVPAEELTKDVSGFSVVEDEKLEQLLRWLDETTRHRLRT